MPIRSLIATNGYTGSLLPELQRRVVPVSSYIIATEALPAELARHLSPRGRMFVDGNRLLSYFRLSPDGRRVLFGGRLHLRHVDERTAARGLYRRMIRVWPELRGYRITHAWKGYLGFTFDRLPHMGGRRRRRPFRHGLQRQRRRDGGLSRPPDRAQDPGAAEPAMPVRGAALSDPRRVPRPRLVSAGARALVPVPGRARLLEAGLGRI